MSYMNPIDGHVTIDNFSTDEWIFPTYPETPVYHVV